MYWRLQNAVLKEFTNVIRRLFSYNDEWKNRGLEIVEFKNHEEHVAFENFFAGNERYPVITLGAMGGNFIGTGVNNMFRTSGSDAIELGTRAQHAVEITNDKKLIVPVPHDVVGETITGMTMMYAWTGDGTARVPLRVTIKDQDDTTVGTIDMPGTEDTRFRRRRLEFSDPLALQGEGLTMTIESLEVDIGNVTVDSQTSPEQIVHTPYYVAIDTSRSEQYLYRDDTVGAPGMVNGSVILPAYVRIGSRYEGNIMIKCVDKNSTNTLYNVSELISMYFYMLRHGKVSRDDSKATDGIEHGPLTRTIREFRQKGIALQSIALSPLTNELRGKDDRIFTLPISIQYSTEWHQDYGAETIEDIIVKISRSTVEN